MRKKLIFYCVPYQHTESLSSRICILNDRFKTDKYTKVHTVLSGLKIYIVISANITIILVQLDFSPITNIRDCLRVTTGF